MAAILRNSKHLALRNKPIVVKSLEYWSFLITIYMHNAVQEGVHGK